MTRHGHCDSKSAHSWVVDDVRTSFPEVDCPIQGLALRCGSVVDDDGVRRGHAHYDLGDVGHGNIECPWLPTCTLGFAPALEYG